MSLANRIGDRLSYAGRSSRRLWTGNQRAHIEVRGLGNPEGASVAAAVEQVLARVAGVDWAQMDLVQHRVVVAGEALSPPQLVEAIEAVEADYGVERCRFPLDASEHPGDREPLVRHALALSADVAGLGLGVVGRVLRATPLPVEAASMVTLIDNEPRIRHFLEAHLGTPTADLGLAIGNAVGQSLSQGPIGLLADGTHRVNLVLETAARRQAFARAEAKRWGEERLPADLPAPLPAADHPRRVPDGPVELYSDRASLAGLSMGAATYAATRSPRRAAALVLAAIPKAARLGREAFAAHLDRTLAARDLLVLNAEALRRLDRVDTVIIDGGLLSDGRSAISDVRMLADADAVEVHRHLGLLFDPLHPTVPANHGRWSLGQPDAAERRQVAVRRARAELETDRTMLLRSAGRPVAVVSYHDERSSAVLHLIRAARRQGHMVVLATSTPSAIQGVDVDLVVDRGDGLLSAIRQMQEDECVVALIAPGGSERAEALRAADVSLELPSLDGAAWSGDILVNEIEDVSFVLDAIASGREVSRQSVALSAVGSSIGALLSFTVGPGRAAGRATTAVNLAALAAMGNGIRAVAYLRRHGGRLPAEPVRWHEMTVDEVLDRVTTTPQGLTAAESARRRQADDGVQTPEPSLRRSILSELANPLTPILAGGAVASAAVGSPVDAGIVAGVSALNALIGGAQRFGAERAIVALSEASQTWVTVLRPGEAADESSDDLVPGDVVVLRAGDAVPADCRIVAAEATEVDESSLTGESVTVTKDPAPTYSATLGERTSMLYEGTTVAAGEVVAVVVAVGDGTVANAMLPELAAAPTSGGVEARLKTLTSLILPLSAAGGASVLGLGLLRGRSMNQSVGSAVALAVAAVPEGLPVLATIAQLASARRLSRRQALVRNPRAIEALGRVRVLCTDKTGTLTEGRIRLRGVSDGTREVGADDLPSELVPLVAAGLRASPIAERGVALPHLTDRAVVDGAHRCHIETTTGAPGWARQLELCFEPARGYHAAVGTTGDRRLLSVKGAPETLFPRCTTWRSPAGDIAIDNKVRRRLDREVDRLARQGLRILAVGEATVPPSDSLGDEDIAELTLLGFLILSDPVRATAAQAVLDLTRAGVSVLMVTGDHPSTAQGIAAELGILNGKRVVTGAALSVMGDDQLDEIIDDVSVFARVTPADKVRVVLALQRRGEPVAMTGDGANDAPAIRLADVGIALGDHATPAARRAAALVVTDERIETIVDAIIEGRAMWASLREALAILLGGNVGEVAFTVGATALTGRAPLSARQLLAVNLLTDVAPALAIALRPPPTSTPEALLGEGPDASLGRSLERAIALRAASTALGAGMAWGMASLTGRPRRASTVALVGLVGSQLGQTVVVGGRDPLVLLAGLGSAAVLTAIVQTPGVSHFFGCTPLGPVAWSMAIGSSGVATAASVAGQILLRRGEGSDPGDDVTPDPGPGGRPAAKPAPPAQLAPRAQLAPPAQLEERRSG
ncbi:MAG: cation-translocating P-type ATPase [Actinomycetota bacterium]|nr:cation-translocating P-type ATPase [Actinomycetota bacterium]